MRHDVPCHAATAGLHAGLSAMIVKYTLFWFPMVVIAVINGAIRDLTYKACAGEPAAHQISTATGLFLFGIYIWALGLRWKLKSGRQAFAVGFIWLGMTEAFEFLFFHYTAGHSWEQIIQAHNLFEGRLWVLVLIFVAIAPYIRFRLNRSQNEG